MHCRIIPDTGEVRGYRDIAAIPICTPLCVRVCVSICLCTKYGSSYRIELHIPHFSYFLACS